MNTEIGMGLRAEKNMFGGYNVFLGRKEYGFVEKIEKNLWKGICQDTKKEYFGKTRKSVIAQIMEIEECEV